MELRIYFLRKLTSIGNQTFLRKFYTTKIWSYTVLLSYYRPSTLVLTMEEIIVTIPECQFYGA